MSELNRESRRTIREFAAASAIEDVFDDDRLLEEKALELKKVLKAATDN